MNNTKNPKGRPLIGPKIPRASIPEEVLANIRQQAAQQGRRDVVLIREALIEKFG